MPVVAVEVRRTIVIALDIEQFEVAIRIGDVYETPSISLLLEVYKFYDLGVVCVGYAVFGIIMP